MSQFSAGAGENMGVAYVANLGSCHIAVLGRETEDMGLLCRSLYDLLESNVHVNANTSD